MRRDREDEGERATINNSGCVRGPPPYQLYNGRGHDSPPKSPISVGQSMQGNPWFTASSIPCCITIGHC